MIYNLLSVSLIAANPLSSPYVLKQADDSMPSPKEADAKSEAETSNAPSEGKMFFWPIWTARSDIPFPTEADPDSENKTKSDSQVTEVNAKHDSYCWNLCAVQRCQDDNSCGNCICGRSKGKNVDNKMFFWPIWTKSDAPVPDHMKRRLERRTPRPIPRPRCSSGPSG